MLRCISILPGVQQGRAKLFQTGGVTSKFRQAKRRGGIQNGLGIDAVVAIEIRQVAGLSEMLDPKRLNELTEARAKPFQAARVAVLHRHQPGLRIERREQALDLAKS